MEMTQNLQIYRCDVCGNMVEVVRSGKGQLVCCGQPMILEEANTKDASLEKHVPVIEKTEKGFRVQVGETIHPMTEEHYIEWIELLADGQAFRKFLNPGDQPIAEFCIEAKEVVAKEYCNLHGLWQKS